MCTTAVARLGVGSPNHLGARVSTRHSRRFLHADLAYLFFNGFTFWAFGFGLESAMGRSCFAALYAVGLAASAASVAGTWLRHRHDLGYRSLGASGAILAMLFASIVYHPEASIYILPIPLPIPVPLFAALCLAYTWRAARQARGRFNHDAHMSGALSGIAFVALTDVGTLTRTWARVLGRTTSEARTSLHQA